MIAFLFFKLANCWHDTLQLSNCIICQNSMYNIDIMVVKDTMHPL